MIIARKYKLLMLLFTGMVAAIPLVWRSFSYFEPPFVVIGDNEILSKIHVNVYMYRYEGSSSLKTIFMDGKSYKVDNRDVDRFEFYVNYDNRLFSHYGYDNVPRMMGDASLTRNTLLFCKNGSDVYIVTRSKKCEDRGEGVKLLSLSNVIESELSDKMEQSDIRTKDGEKIFILDLKRSFFDIV